MNAPDLAGRITEHIRRHGPVSVAAFMALALHDAQAGYYTRRDPLGRRGDFITAPEISQIFGELIGVWCADLWRRMGAPEAFLLAELGPGHGTLMADLLHAAEAVPFRRALRLCLIEASPMLRAEQQARLAFAAPMFLDHIEELPPGPLLLIANEFLDALPIRQLVRGRSEWAERLVGLDANARLAFVLGP
jgi:NADH dehydrogenase [ubiquinone] 1 alpha subcomplex assembly factor 7